MLMKMAAVMAMDQRPLVEFRGIQRAGVGAVVQIHLGKVH